MAESPVEFHDHDHPVYRNDLMLSEVGDPAIDGVTPLTPAEVVARYAERGEDTEDLLETLEELASGDRPLTFLDPGSADPFDLSEEVEGLSPIFAGSFLPHFGFGPAGPPNDKGVPFVPAPRPWPGRPQGNPVVAVVDTGLVRGVKLPAALAGRINAATPADFENPGQFAPTLAGHGTFVATIIASIDPRLEVVVAQMAPVPAASITSRGQVAQHRWTDEIQFANALTRLRSKRLPYAALNLSVGFYVPPAKNPVAVQKTLAGWAAAYPSPDGESRIVAAAGNFAPGTTGSGSSWPATDPNVIGVESTDNTGTRSTFSMSDPSYWSAVGENVSGIRLASGVETEWSGTSFAAPQVAAWRALGLTSGSAATQNTHGNPHIV